MAIKAEVTADRRPGKVRAWIEAMRLRTLPVSVAGVLAGVACALHYGVFRMLPAVGCLLFAVLAQIASNFANEYYDFRNGLDRKGREGFRRGVTEGDISPSSMKRATYALLLLDSLLGCSLLLWGEWWMLLAGIAIAIFALGYSTGPYPLSHHGLGDVAVVIFFGVVPVILTAWLQTGSAEALPISLPVGLAIGLMTANVLIVNNYRDADDDAKVGKRTTVVIFGREMMAAVYLLAGVNATAFMLWAFWGTLSLWWLMAPAAYLSAHTALYIAMLRRRGQALNPLLGMTAMLVLAVAVVLLLSQL